ncbi:MAG: DUF3014 domain-containing protein [Rubrivivax sp.]
MTPRTGLIGVLLLLGLGLAAWWWWPQAEPVVTLAAPQAALVEPPATAASVAVPAVQFPLETQAGASAPPSAQASDAVLKSELIELAGKNGVLSFLQLDGFVRRVVVTVDNLDRVSASARLWPVVPAAGHFLASGEGEQMRIDADNGLRYAPFVQFIESIDSARAVALYRWMYPLFQQSYQELGYPNRYFNDRLVQVIDHLLQTPVPPEPIAVTLTQIKGPVVSLRPWVHHSFTDPELEQRSAGQKLLMRMGNVNERRLKAKLIELRAQLVTQVVKR